ncbi:Large proline-rich protein bag6 [Ancistrocladus abbreviatus]
MVDRANAAMEGRKETKAGESKDVRSEERKEREGLKEAGDEEPQEVSKVEQTILSGTEAAVIIQSAYRGYEVRRWEPLKKLRQIAKGREEAAEISGRINALDSEHSVDNKQKAELGETIMKLLLRLDTIQGLHPSLRDIRKYVAKELISLQEKLDSLMMEKEPSAEEISPEIVDDYPNSAIEDSAKGGEKEGKTSNEDGNSYLRELPPDTISNSRNEETLDKAAKLSVGYHLQGEGVEVMNQLEPCENETIIKEIPTETQCSNLDSADESSLGVMESNIGCAVNKAIPFSETDKEVIPLAQLPQAVTVEHNEIAPEDTVFSPAKDLECEEVKVDSLESVNAEVTVMPEVTNGRLHCC